MALIKRSLVVACVIVGSILSTCEGASATSSVPAVLILDDSDAESPVSRQIREQIHSMLDAETTQPYTKYTEFLNLGYFNASRYSATLHAYLKNKYSDTPVRLIVSVGREALDLSLRLRADTWPQAPIIFASFNNDAATDPHPPNATGIIVSRKFQDLLRAAQLLVPDLARIALVGDSVTQQPHRHRYPLGLRQAAEKFNVINLTNLPLAAVEARVSALPNDAAIVYLPIFSDKSGIVHDPREALDAIARVANRPIVVDAENLIGQGATGGFVLSANDVGHEIGRLAARVLKGESPSNIPIVAKSFLIPVFDARQLERWHISRSALPAGSDVRYQQLSAWDQYWWQIVTAITVIAIQCLVIGWLLIERQRRRLAQAEAHERLREVMDLRRVADASAMSSSITHDLAQPLGAILSNAEAARSLLAHDSPDLNQVREIVDDICHDDKLATEIISHLRGLLKPKTAKLEIFDLNDAIKNTMHLLKFEAEKNGVNVIKDFVLPSARVRADTIHAEQLMLNLAMNAIEAMKKVPRRDRKLKLKTEILNQSEVRVSVSDRGKGIPHDQLEQIFKALYTTKSRGTGLGLTIARTIVESYGGKIWAENRPEGGATFFFTLPLTPSYPT